MNELAKEFGLVYAVKYYINRTDLYVDQMFDLYWCSKTVYWSYNKEQLPSAIIFLKQEGMYDE